MDYVAALRKVKALRYIERAAIITTEGKLVASSWQELSENAASDCAEFLQMVLQYASLTQRGNVEAVGFTTHESTVRFIYIEEKTVLIVVMHRSTSMIFLYQD